MLGENIKNARKALGLSQEELAIKINVVRQTVSKWEKGEALPSIEFLPKLSEILNCEINDFFVVNSQNKYTPLCFELVPTVRPPA